ncbi:uncharacterized protein [Henckelia pumila]|uniref:uncharacterized protein n=1 Tax=Henckelia pumila TaxID=405737 RepID=UPI003C6E50DF
MDNTDRRWMYRRFENGYVTDDYINGVEDFIVFALTHAECLSSGKIRCPCNDKKCQNKVFLDPVIVKVHLGRNGIVPNYYNWHLHGEVYIRPNFSNTNQDVPSSSRAPNRSPQYVDPNSAHVETPNTYIKGLYDLIKSSEKAIWEGNPHGHSLLSVLARLLKMKQEHNMSERNFDDMCKLMSELCPAKNHMPSSFNSTKKFIKDLCLPVEKIDSCKNNCMIYWGTDSDLTECKICEHPRYKPSRRRENHNRSKQTPYKRMYYFPITPRLQRLYASTATASHMRWHHDHHFDGDTMTHPSDSLAWCHFDETHPGFADEIRNVRLGISTDGFQPFGQTGQQYSTWPIIVTPYNLPPWMCMKDEVMFLFVIAPGPSNPKDKLDVFLQPLIAELRKLWYDGAATYDIHSQSNFTLRAALMWTWNTSWFDNHKKFLPDDHPLRRKKNMFIRGRTVYHPAPAIRTGTELINELDNYGFLPSYDVDAENRNRDICKFEKCGWRRRSILWELPYWRTNIIRHNLDVMHVEKNVFDNVFNTVMNVPGRTKDNAKSRADLIEMPIRQPNAKNSAGLELQFKHQFGVLRQIGV